jgi:hypothetical protein
VAETQEPTIDFEIELQESEAQNAATLPSSSQVAEKLATHSVAETQEPATDTEIDIQELEAQGVATLLFLHQEAETQGAAPIPAAYSPTTRSNNGICLAGKQVFKVRIGSI